LRIQAGVYDKERLPGCSDSLGKRALRERRGEADTIARWEQIFIAGGEVDHRKGSAADERREAAEIVKLIVARAAQDHGSGGINGKF